MEEASDRGVARYRRRKRRTRLALAACFALVVLAGVMLRSPLQTAWELRNTVTSWPTPIITVPGASVKPSSSVFVSAEMPDQRKFSAEIPFTLSVGLGQASNYEHATLSVTALGYEITDEDGNTVRDRYVRTFLDFNSGDYGVTYNDRHSITGCEYLEDFTFRYVGENATGWGAITLSLQSRNSNSIMGDAVTVYYILEKGALKLTDKSPVQGDQNGNGTVLYPEETMEMTDTLSREDISVSVQLDTTVFARFQYFGDCIKITARHKTYLTEYSTAKFTAELIYAETLREGDYSFFLKKPFKYTEEGYMSVIVQRVPVDAPIGAYDLRITDLETGFVWTFENMACVLPALPGEEGIPAYEDYVCEATATKPSLMQGEYFVGEDFNVFEISVWHKNGEDRTWSCTAWLTDSPLGHETMTEFIVKTSGLSSIGALPYIRADMPAGHYDLVVRDDYQGYIWVFENFIEITANPDAQGEATE